MKRLRFVLTTAPRVNPRFKRAPDTSVSFAPMDALADGLGGLAELETKVFSEVASGSYNYFENGDVLLAKVTPCFENGKKAIARDLENGAGFATSEVLVFRPDSDGIDTRYLRYLFCSEDFRHKAIASMTGAGGLRRVSERAVLDFPLRITDLATQRQIADFLDRETARIDLLIEKKQRLGTVLEEKLSAVISNAVRGYLTSHDAPRRRDIEWFDSYPEHWTRMPLKALGNGHRSVFIDGDWIESKDLADEGIRYLTTGNVGPGTYKEQGAGFISTETFARLKCTEVFPGDILISRLNPPIGRACIVPDLGTRIVTSVDNVIVRPGDHVDRQYIVHLLTSREHFENTGNIARGTTMQRISRSALGKIRIPLPPLAEQQEISRHLGAEVQWHQSLSERISCSIDRLKEYRSALITAAVTGQIDVSTYAKSGTPDRRLDAIQEEMQA